MFWIVIFLCPILVCGVWFIRKYLEFRRIKTYAEKIPGVDMKGILTDIFGTIVIVPMFLKDLDKIPQFTTAVLLSMPMVSKPNDGMIVLRALHNMYIVIIQADYAEVLLSSNVLTRKSPEYEMLHSWLGNGLITVNGSQWRKHRKILTPAFHFRILDEFIPIVNEQAGILVEKLESQLHEPWTDISSYITKCALDVICETSMGIQIGCQNDEEPEYIRSLKVVQECFLLRSALPFLHPNLIFYSLPIGRRYRRSLNKVQAFTRRVVRERKYEMSNTDWKRADESSSESDTTFRRKKSRLAFLDLLLHYHINDKSLTEEEIQDEVNTFMFAGHDTTSQAMVWTLYLLGLHPDVQARVHEEIDAIFGTNKERPANADDLRNMKYLECVIKESQRLYPPVPVLARELTEDTVFGGKIVPKGMGCILSVLGLHRDRKVFPKPHHFMPDRFLPENSRTRHPYAFIPFSAGPRNCIGQRFAMNEEKIILSTILRHFKASSLDQRDKIILSTDIILRPCSPIRMKFTRRM